ncbi:MAG: ETHE1 protein, mitochondrial precursor [Monoraphidium minutum]|nr:MAG: ETHE1 protein, mitochondrial precursor [Monoraphidium minutum]
MSALMSTRKVPCAAAPAARVRRAPLVVRAFQTSPKKAVAKPALTNGVIFRQLFDTTSSTYTYLLADPATADAVLIDPVLEQVERDLEIVDQLGLNLVEVTNTHCHADHITGSGKIKALRKGVRSSIAAASGAAGDVKLADGDALRFGRLALRVIATPGHTSGCISFYLPPAGPVSGGMVFTGDALLIRGCGRTDFQGGDSGELFDNLHAKVLALPEDTLVFPGHDYKGRTSSSVGEERAHNPRLTKGRGAFIDLMAGLNLPYPKQIDRALPANLNDGTDFPYA